MATKYGYYIDGKRIAILKEFDDSPVWRIPDSAEEDAILFQYSPKISAPTSETEEIGVNDYLALAIVEYVKSKLAQDEGDYRKSQFHYKQFKIKVNENEDAYRGGPIVIAPPRIALR